ncbi:Abi family protein [Curtobacterium sp. MCBD17_040]|uniref:Abi family protein n=1 Tax=Curtobacterium sp. MCBD17_040 TaxID=2175674 RepID=UPI000DA8A12F|nr:Abi family protein [Curtobacterium sp. MCBD17_040]WIB63438.1 Abi family protein [Curtobacterium sp. MCBD17_040]
MDQNGQASVWFLEWVSRPRFERYLQAAGHDHARARSLYNWNARLAAAFLHDLAHLEVGLRNSFDTALMPAVRGNDSHWTDPRTLSALFPRHHRRSGPGASNDPNAFTLKTVHSAKERAGRTAGPFVRPDHIVAELPLGFWTYLASDRHEKTIWVPYLRSAYPVGTSRTDVRDALDTLRRFRNRVAHHECIMQGAETHRRRLVGQVRRLSEEAARDLARRSEVARLLHERP